MVLLLQTPYGTFHSKHILNDIYERRDVTKIGTNKWNMKAGNKHIHLTSIPIIIY